MDTNDTPAAPSSPGPVLLLEYIRQIMASQGNHKNPRKYIVLRSWNQIVDHDMVYDVMIPPVGPFVAKGTRLWAMERRDSPDLILATVITDHGPQGLWVAHPTKPIQWLVPREDAKLCPMPFRALAIRRKDLNQYLGETLARVWHERRRVRLHKQKKDA